MLLRVTLSKMVSAKCLNPELINLDFWRRIPNKFRGIRFYEDRKTKIQQLADAKQPVSKKGKTKNDIVVKKISKKASRKRRSSPEKEHQTKKKKPISGEIIEEEEGEGEEGEQLEEDLEQEDICNQSTYGESIYEDFDN